MRANTNPGNYANAEPDFDATKPYADTNSDTAPGTDANAGKSGGSK